MVLLSGKINISFFKKMNIYLLNKHIKKMMILSGICRSEFNVNKELFIKKNIGRIFINVDTETLLKINKHWGNKRKPIIYNRVMINTRTPVELDKWMYFHVKLVRYTAYEGKEKFSNCKMVLDKVSSYY